jgi:xylulokinase
MPRYLIAHDLGTSGNKATLFTIEGEMVKSITYSYPTRFYNGNWAEQNPKDWWKAVCITNHQLLDKIDKSQVAGLAFSGQMMGCVIVDQKGDLLQDAIIWADQRSVEEENEIRSKMDEKDFYRITGHKISASYSIEKLMWIRNHKPELFAKVYKMLLPKDYIIYRLTGKFVTDYSDASGTNAFDINQLQWSEQILQAAGIPLQMMPEARPSTDIVGEVTSDLAEECGLAPGTKIIIGGGDGVCAAVGAASVTENVAYNYLGSSSWVAYSSKEPVFDKEMRTFNWVHLVPGYYTPNGAMQAAGNSFQFMKDVLCDGLQRKAQEEGNSVYDLMNEEIANSRLGANGLIFLPYLLGERSPRWNSDARGAFIGLKMEHTKGDMLRATVEGILMNLSIVLDIFKDKSPITSINIIGGLAQGEQICQILANIYGVPAYKLNYLEEATSIGAAVTAGVGAGVLKGFEEVCKFIRIDTCVKPNMDSNKQYGAIKQIFDQSYYALLDIYKKLAAL